MELSPGEVDVLNIDVEGWETKVLRGFDLAYWRPGMVVIEINTQADFLAEAQRVGEDLPATYAHIRKVFADAGYWEYWRDDINTIFVRPGLAHAPFPRQ
mmetsp:Transcript_26571/g.69843  ORF Transcript_26571/g.69843 Transcript_26571/m.69843 type:complete len:99 (-) Transcript_26571:133-429(-)